MYLYQYINFEFLEKRPIKIGFQNYLAYKFIF